MDGGKTWTDWKVVLYPTLDSEDKWSTCDPGAFKYGDYYYVGYTGSPEFRTDPSKEKAVNNLFIARAKNPEGPYEKWNGSGWGGKPYAITRYSGNGVGCSMPAFTVKDDRLYMYYVDQTKDDQDWNSYGNISVSVFPLKDPNWPGKQISNDRCKNEPEEVKYCPETGKFIGFQLLNGWDYDSYVSVMESKDGINFEKTTTFRSNFPHYAHNIGVSGNTLGQLDLSITNYIGAAYTPTGRRSLVGALAHTACPALHKDGELCYNGKADHHEAGDPNHQAEKTDRYLTGVQTGRKSNFRCTVKRSFGTGFRRNHAGARYDVDHPPGKLCGAGDKGVGGRPARLGVYGDCRRGRPAGGRRRITLSFRI